MTDETGQPEGVPRVVERLFLALCNRPRHATLVAMRDKATGRPRYIVFFVHPQPDDPNLGRFEIVGELYGPDSAQSVLDGVEPFPESGLDLRPPTEVPAAFNTISDKGASPQ